MHSVMDDLVARGPLSSIVSFLQALCHQIYHMRLPTECLSVAGRLSMALCFIWVVCHMHFDIECLFAISGLPLIGYLRLALCLSACLLVMLSVIECMS